MGIPNQPENRVFPRVSCNSAIRFQVKGEQRFENTACNDISEGGVRFTSGQFLPTSTALQLEINLFNRVLKPAGRVAWAVPLAHAYNHQLGIEFLEFDKTERDILRDFIIMRLGV